MSDYYQFRDETGTPIDYYQLVDDNNNLCKEIERLNKKIEQYENPEDMTLMFMWCNEKAKDEIKRLNNIIKRSITKVQEVKDHIDKSKFDGTTKSILIMALNEIIHSLNGKGVDKE